MADPLSPAVAVCAGGITCIPFLVALGMDPVNMVAGLAGVVVVQAFLPRKDGDKSLKGVVLFGSASMFVAAWGGPVLAAGAIGALPENWQWIKTLPTEHVKAVSAGIAGGFAQPFLLWLQSKWPKPAPPVKE